MKAFLILLAVFLFFLLMPVVLHVQYQKELKIKVGIFFPFYCIYPREGKAKKETGKSVAIDKPEKKGEKDDWKNDLELFKELLSHLPEYFRRLICVKKLQFYAELGDDDPGDLAMKYGAMNTAWGSLAPLLEELYPVEKWDVRITANFERKASEYHADFRCKTNLMRAIGALISFAYHSIINMNDKKEIVTNGK